MQTIIHSSHFSWSFSTFLFNRFLTYITATVQCICLLMLATMCIGRMNSSILHLFSGSDVENREVVFVKHEWSSCLSTAMRVITPRRKCTIKNRIRSELPFIREQGENVESTLCSAPFCIEHERRSDYFEPCENKESGALKNTINR